MSPSDTPYARPSGRCPRTTRASGLSCPGGPSSVSPREQTVRPTPLSGRERSRSHRGANAARFNAACRHAGDWTFLDAVWRPRGVNVAANCVWMVEKFGYVATLTVLYGQGRLALGQFAVCGPDFVLGLLFVASFLRTSQGRS